MKIIELRAENVKKIRAISIRPDGNVVQITGKNGQGKTCVLDSIFWALAGAAAIQGAPVRTGENAARIKVDLGELVVTRRFKRTDAGEVVTDIIVENAEGVRMGSPQKVLDALLGELSFDPLAFARMDAKAQFDTLRRFVPGVDFDAIEAAQRADYDRRTTFNRQAKEARAQAAGLNVPVDAPTAKVDESGLVADMTRAAEHNSKVVRLASQAAARADRITQLRAELGRLEAEAEAAPPIPATVDVAALEQKITAAHKANEAYAALRQHVELIARADELERQSADLTAQMEARERAKRDAIAAAAMPVPDLDFGEGVVLKAGVPFDQASDAEKLRASVAIAMAMNPKVRVIRIQDGSLLDSASRALIAELADQHDCQVWIESVDESGKVGFVIEDGAVVAQEAAHV